MRNSIILTCLTLLLNFTAFGQNEKYKTTSDSELDLFKDLILSLKDNSFVISPLIEERVDVSMLRVSQLTNKYGFTRNQFKSMTKDTLQIKKNKYFEVANPDSIIKFHNLGLYLEINDSTYISAPYYYFIEKTYHKKCICTFSKVVFSKDKTYAVVKYMIRCGMDDGRGETVLMKKTKHKWIIIDTFAFHGS